MLICINTDHINKLRKFNTHPIIYKWRSLIEGIYFKSQEKHQQWSATYLLYILTQVLYYCIWRKYFLYLLYILYVIHFPYLEKSFQKNFQVIIYSSFVHKYITYISHITYTYHLPVKAKLPIIEFHFSMGESIFPMFTC